MSLKGLIAKMADGRINRTGVQASPKDAARSVEGAELGTPDVGGGFVLGGNGSEAARLRREYAEAAEPVGTMPPPGTVRGMTTALREAMSGARGLFLLDKIAERLAFERTGVRLYDDVLVAFDVHGTFDGGPSRVELERIQSEEAQHFLMLEEAIEDLGGDPTAMTPSADLAAVEGMGLTQALAEPRRTLPEALHAILVAELADNEGWRTLVELCEELDHRDLADEARAALAEEDEHLSLVRTWLGAYTRAAVRVGGPEAPGVHI